MAVGVVVERRTSDHPWQDHCWRPYAVIPGGGPGGGWRRIADGPGWQRYYAGSLELELHRNETESYRLNLASALPRVYVVLRPDSGQHEVEPLLVTASPDEAQGFSEAGDDQVEGIPMPAEIVAWVSAFADRQPAPAPFVKRSKTPKTGTADGQRLARRAEEDGHGR
jgi:hypothetical protein